MFTRLILLSVFLWFSALSSFSQTIYVDPLKGNDGATGLWNQPVASIARAVHLAANFTGAEPVAIKLFPGLFLLTDQIELNPYKTVTDTAGKNDTSRFTIEAVVLPDDTNWLPSRMPVIQSVSPNNKNWKSFDHCTGFQVQRNNIHFRGLKFVGNSNPGVVYYYAIERHFPELKGLNISQCLFTGSRNSAPIQGALFAQGPGIKIDHTIFYECKNAVLSFMNVSGFSLTNSIIYGSYEGAIWFGKFSDIKFRNNIVANNRCFWVSMKDYEPHYVFENSVIVNNDIFMGVNNDGLIEPDSKIKPSLRQIQQSGQVQLQMVSTDTIPKHYLHPVKGSPGSELGAGLFLVYKPGQLK
jgi:hypothetical protein